MAVPHSAASDVWYNGFRIPSGATIMPNVYGVTRNAEYFDDPEAFDPDRYMSSPFGVKKGKQIYEAEETCLKDMSFGFGRRSCPGMILAKNSIAMNTMYFLWAFNILKGVDANGNAIEPDLKALKLQFTLETPSFSAIIKPRSLKHAEIIKQDFLDATPIFTPFEQELSDEDVTFLETLRKDANSP